MNKFTLQWYRDCACVTTLFYNWFAPVCNFQLIKRCENSAQHLVWQLYCIITLFVGVKQFGCCMFRYSCSCAVQKIKCCILYLQRCCNCPIFCVQCTLCVSAWLRDLLPSSTICNVMLTAGFSINWLTRCVGTIERRHLSESGSLERSSAFKN